MASTPTKLISSSKTRLQSPDANLKSTAQCRSFLTPKTPQTNQQRRSSARLSLKFDEDAVTHDSERNLEFEIRSGNLRRTPRSTPKRARTETPFQKSSQKFDSKSAHECLESKHSRSQSSKAAKKLDFDEFLSPVSPDCSEKKRRRHNLKDHKIIKSLVKQYVGKTKRSYLKHIVYDGCLFQVGDDVYVKRRDNTSSEDEPEAEECRICFSSGNEVMIECDDCLGGFHLACVEPPLMEVPEGEWVCKFCEDKRLGRESQFPKPPAGKKRARTLRERYLSGDLWAARMESLWKEGDGSYWFKGRWYIIPEETVSGRQPHNLKREIYQTNDFANIEMESIIRHCFVKNPSDYTRASNEGDDVFMCEYEYDVHWHNFKRIADINIEEDGENGGLDDEWNSSNNTDPDTEEEDITYHSEKATKLKSRTSSCHGIAANSPKGQSFGLQKIGTKRIPHHVRCHKPTELEKAKARLLLATFPKSLPCRNREMEEITYFIKGATCNYQCLGRCLYVHGVPGTGKTMCALAVMRSLRSEVDAGRMQPYCFIEVNGLKLASPEYIYRVIFEALSGHRVSWKRALQYLTERFSEGKRMSKEDNRPCILLIDELDLLITRNQSVLYTILDWPTKPHSKLIVIGIANTMDLPEKLLPRVSSRMGIQRLCFGPYNFHQLQEIISSRVEGINAFEKQAIEFVSRKVAAISGDARRALEICRRAAEVADFRIKKSSSNPGSSLGKDLVSMADMDAAIQEMFQAPHIQVMRKCSRFSKIFLTAMVHELYKTGMTETTFEHVVMLVMRLCLSNGETFPGWDALMKIGCALGASKIILCEAGAMHRLQKLQFNFPSDDVVFALKDCKEVSWLPKYL